MYASSVTKHSLSIIRWQLSNYTVFFVRHWERRRKETGRSYQSTRKRYCIVPVFVKHLARWMHRQENGKAYWECFSWYQALPYGCFCISRNSVCFCVPMWFELRYRCFIAMLPLLPANPPLPETFSLERRLAQLDRMKKLDMNPIDGLCARK